MADTLEEANAWVKSQKGNQGGGTRNVKAPDLTKDRVPSRGPILRGLRRTQSGAINLLNEESVRKATAALARYRTAKQAYAALKAEGITDFRGWNELIDKRFAGKAASTATRGATGKKEDEPGRLTKLEGAAAGLATGTDPFSRALDLASGITRGVSTSIEKGISAPIARTAAKSMGVREGALRFDASKVNRIGKYFGERAKTLANNVLAGTDELATQKAGSGRHWITNLSLIHI